jgi:hypothetical protein
VLVLVYRSWSKVRAEEFDEEFKRNTVVMLESEERSAVFHPQTPEDDEDHEHERKQRLRRTSVVNTIRETDGAQRVRSIYAI